MSEVRSFSSIDNLNTMKIAREKFNTMMKTYGYKNEQIEFLWKTYYDVLSGTYQYESPKEYEKLIAVLFESKRKNKTK